MKFAILGNDYGRVTPAFCAEAVLETVAATCANGSVIENWLDVVVFLYDVDQQVIKQVVGEGKPGRGVGSRTIFLLDVIAISWNEGKALHVDKGSLPLSQPLRFERLILLFQGMNCIRLLWTS
jgi:hypothetical protein